MRVGLVRNVALGMVGLIGLGFAGCDDNPTDFGSDETVAITTNPSTMILPAGVTTLLVSRTENAGNEPTWEEVTATIDGTCGGGAVTVAVAATYEPSIQPPGVFDVSGGNTIGESCIQLSGGGVETTVEVTVVGDSLTVDGAPANGFVDLFESVDLSGSLLSDAGDAVGPFDPDTELSWSSDDEAVMTVDGTTGVVTAIGVGSATITATWTNAGAVVSEDVSLSTNAPTLAITPADPDSLLIDTSIDLSVALVDPTDPPATFGPFDENTDVQWTTVDSDGDVVQDNGIVSVDMATGEVTAVGAGTATVTATWIPSIVVEGGEVVNNPVTAQVDIDVDVPTPTLVSAAPTAGDLGDLITLTGTGFHPAMSIVLDEEGIDALYEPTIVNATTATFHLPFGDDGDVSVQVGAPGQLSGAVTVTRTIVASEATEPDNDASATAPTVTIPLDMWGTVDVLDQNDRFAFSFAVDTTVDIVLDWTGPSDDLDLLFTDNPATAFDACTFDTATGAHPETATCTFTAGDYLLRVNSYDHEAAIYHLEISIAAP